MRVLICITNNLKYDTRVKRHTAAIAEQGHTVHVAACPVPDESFALDETAVEAAGITYSMTAYTPGEHPVNKKILEFAGEYGLEKILLESFPLLSCSAYYYEPCIETYTQLLDQLVSGGRWTDITSRCSEEMPLSAAVSYPICFFERCVQYAQEVLKYPAEVVLCNDIDTILAGVVHKIKYHSRLIYDFHDLAADLSEYVFPQMYSNVLALFEKKMISYADAVMSVSSSALVWSRQHYGFAAPMYYMPNCSAYSISKDSIKKDSIISVQEAVIRIYYHGMCDASRGLAELLQAVKSCAHTAHFHLVLRCLPSEYLEELKSMAVSLHMQPQVSFLEPVSPEHILVSARQDGDIGFAFCQTGKCLNWRFALQNKFIEYMKAGLPVLTSNTMEQGSIVKKYRAGWVLKENTVQGIKDALERIWADRKKLPQLSERAWKCSERIFNWNIYEKRLQSLIGCGKNKYRHAVTCRENTKLLRQWEMEDARQVELLERELKRT